MQPDDRLVSQHRESMADVTALAEHHGKISAIAARLTACLQGGGTIYLCGNGGSAADAQHVAVEFVGQFLRERRPLPAVALTCNTSILAAIGNHYEFSEVFSRRVQACVSPRDCVVGISKSGRSPNLLNALAAARERGAVTNGFTCAEGRGLADLCDTCLLAPSSSTPRIQEPASSPGTSFATTSNARSRMRRGHDR